jgi:hypothetical protein
VALAPHRRPATENPFRKKERSFRRRFRGAAPQIDSLVDSMAYEIGIAPRNGTALAFPIPEYEREVWRLTP